MKMKHLLFLSTILAAQNASQAKAGKWRDFCERYLFADDPHEGEETIAEARRLYPDEDQLRAVLKDIYYSEINQPRPRRSITNAIETFFGGKP